MARPLRTAQVCGHRTRQVKRGMCESCYTAWRRKLYREGREGVLQPYRGPRPPLTLPVPALTFGERTCPGCGEAYIARTAAQRYCSIWCAMPRRPARAAVSHEHEH